MTTATVATDQIEHALDAAYEKGPAEWIPSPAAMLGEATSWWTFGTLQALWPLHVEPDGAGCDGPSCRNAPAWERDWDATFATVPQQLEAECIALVRTRLREMVEEFAAAPSEVRL
jgi:hypothetical protein